MTPVAALGRPARLALAVSAAVLLSAACAGGGEPPPVPREAAALLAGQTPVPADLACGTPLATGAEAAGRVAAEYSDWKRRYMAAFGRDGLLRVKAGAEYREGTPSEAIGYGMLLAVYLDDRRTFDGLWRYAKRFRNERGLMAWSVSPRGEVVDSNAATDGDEDMAFALLVAERRWGGYAADARALIAALLRHGVEPGTDVFKPGDTWGGSDVTNPSYFAPAYYKAFARFSDEPRWLRVADSSYRILDRVAAGHSRATGLQPEWVTARGDSVRHGDGMTFHFGYNASRVPWRLAMDAAWNCDPRAQRHLRTLNSFFRRTGPEGIRDGYTLGGKRLGRYHNGAFVGPAAAGAVLADDPDYRRAMWASVSRLEPSNYYNDTLRLLALLFASGLMPSAAAG